MKIKQNQNKNDFKLKQNKNDFKTKWKSNENEITYGREPP
jgi:hypothetical protein